MKTAISIPDDVYVDAERLARTLRVSRSRLYSLAVREYLARHSGDQVTLVLDALFSEGVPDDGEFASEAARRTLRDAEW
jgi:predicted transcriptional regulator